VTFGKLANKITIAAFANNKWRTGGYFDRDSQSILLNLTNRQYYKARDDDYGGIWCS
jgi:hypothetical protein